MSTHRYQIGFVLSLLITALSFGAVWLHEQTHHQLPTHTELALVILALAIVQLLVQLIYFLHLGRETKSRDVLALTFAGMLIALVVGGSLWIMANLMQNHGLPYNGDITAQDSED